MLVSYKNQFLFVKRNEAELSLTDDCVPTLLKKGRTVDIYYCFRQPACGEIAFFCSIELTPLLRWEIFKKLFTKSLKRKKTVIEADKLKAICYMTTRLQCKHTKSWKHRINVNVTAVSGPPSIHRNGQVNWIYLRFSNRHCVMDSASALFSNPGFFSWSFSTCPNTVLLTNKNSGIKEIRKYLSQVFE